MAVILALNFYFTNRAQQDMLKEFSHLSTSINHATEAYFQGVLDSLRDESADYLKRSKLPPEASFWIYKGANRDSVYSNIRIEVQKIQQLKDRLQLDLKDEPSPVGKEEMIRIFEKKDKKSNDPLLFQNQKSMHPEDRLPDIPVLQKRIKNMRGKLDSVTTLTEKALTFAHTDSIVGSRLRTIDIDLNGLKGKHGVVIMEDYPPAAPVKHVEGSETFTFQVPDFSIPGETRFIRYNYDTQRMQKAIAGMRNRNIIVTTVLFILSIIIIYFISQRFTRPIHSLKTAFEDVEKGNLNLAVPAASRDEIGDLTRSFNRMVEEMQKNREREKILNRQERLASLGQLAAGVAHEIKNPLNAINLTIEHLWDKISNSGNARVQKYVETIQTEIRRLDKIVNNFLSFIRSENLKKADTDIKSELADVLNLFDREFASQKIKVRTDFAPEFTSLIDAERFKTVFLNIILNAIQAMPDGGTLSISTNSETNSIHIKDTGGGIPEKEIENLFDLLYTTKSTGTGLGLPTAYKIVKEHNGDIEIKSREGEGTEVIITLPG